MKGSSGLYEVTFEVQGGSANVELTGDVLTVDETGVVLESLPIDNGGTVFLGGLVPLKPEDGTRLAILRVKADDGSVAREAFCSPVPFLKMYEPQGRVVSESRGAVTKVMTAIPGMDIGGLSVEIDGVDVLAAMNLNPRADFPGGPYDGSVQVRERLVTVSDLEVGGAAVNDLRDFAALQRCFTGTGPGAPSIQEGCMDYDLGGDGSVGLLDFEALFESFSGPALSLDEWRSNTLTMKLSNLGAGAHILRVDAAPALTSPPAPFVDGIGTLSVFGIHIDSPAEGEILDTVPTPVSGEVRHGRPIAGLTVNGVELDVSSQVMVPGNGVVAGDEYVLPFDTAIEQTDMALDFANLTTDTGTFDPGSNRLIVSATDDLDNQTFLTRLFAVGPVAPPASPTKTSASGGPAGTVGESEIVNAFVLGADSATLKDALQDHCDDLTQVVNNLIRPKLKNWKLEKKLRLGNPSYCDPTVTFTLDAGATRIENLNCQPLFEPGLFTPRVLAQLRHLVVSARGECNVCVSIGDDELEGAGVAVDVDLGLSIPPLSLSLRDWQNELPIDPDRACEGGDRDGHDCSTDQDCCSDSGCCFGDKVCSPDGSVSCSADEDCRPGGDCEGDDNCGGDNATCLGCAGAGDCVPHQSHIRFLEDSLTTPAIEKARVVETTIRDFLDNPIAQTINDKVVEFLRGTEFRDEVDTIASLSQYTVEDLRQWLLERAGAYVPDVPEPAGTAIALESFATTPDEVAISVNARFSALLPPEVQASPGAQLTPAAPPRTADLEGVNLGQFSLIADDVFDQILAVATLLGDFTQQCRPSGRTVGDFFPGCADGGSVPSPGFCAGLRGGDCEALVLPTDQGMCHGVRGDDCTRIRVSPLDLAGVERAACRNTALRNIHQDMPILQCGGVDVPPSFWIRDDFDPEGNPITTPDRVETHLRINDIFYSNIVDRQGDGADGALPALPDCSDTDADPTGDCVLMGACLDLNIAAAIILAADGEQLRFGLEINGVQRLDRPGGVVCRRGVDSGFGQALQSTFETIIEGLLAQITNAVPNLEFGAAVPFTAVKGSLIALTTSEARPGFNDYLGITSTLGETALCGNGTCDLVESCGFSATGSCLRDCGLCPPGHACADDSDCDTNTCVAGRCEESRFAFAPGACEDACLFAHECITGVCNLGVCTALYVLPAFGPCSTGRACRSRSCLNGLCEAVCGDGYCDGEEVCGNEDSTFECHTDCGRCPAGHPCLEDDTCRSGNCLGGFCESVCGDGYCDGTEICGNETSTFECRPDCGLCEIGDECVEDENCRTNVCNLLKCVEANSLPALSPCNNADACRSKSCVGGNCESVCGDGFCDGTEICGDETSTLECRPDCGLCQNGDACLEDENCQSGICVAGFCASCRPLGSGPCLEHADCCNSAVCNLLECIEPNSLPALSPCSTDVACRSGNCQAGLCESVCGDGFCETPSENCGADNSGVECRTDCGRCPNGTPCTEDGDCSSGNCYLGTCRSCKSNGKSCTNNAQCCSTNCYLGTCRRCRSRGESCVNDAQCCSDNCAGVLSRTCQ